MSQPWFHRPGVTEAIEAVGTSRDLTVYAGAGVTIDRTTVGWAHLARLLLNRAGVSVEAADATIRDLSPDKALSAAYELLLPCHGGDTKNLVSNLLRLEIYPHRHFMGGQISRAIARLALGFAGAEQPIRIFTTNYDEYLVLDAKDESEARVQTALPVAEVVQLNPVDPADKPRTIADAENGSTERIEYTYLHGFVAENAKVTGYPVLTEGDYSEANKRTIDLLTEAFKESDVLLLGSSITDPPLLSALLATKAEALANGKRRIALLPLPSLPAGSALADRARRTFLETIEARLAHLGVDVLFPDYYSQVAQFVTESAYAQELAPKPYVQSANRYGARLTQWWDAWKAEATLDKFKEVQGTHYDLCVDQLADIQKAIKCKPSERMKLEVWLRWDPARSRELRLWTSSNCLFTSTDVLRTHSIPNASADEVCVETFRAGHPIHHTTGSSLPGRWRTFLSVPIRLQSGAHPYELPVGTVVLASQQEGSASAIRKDHATRHELAISMMRELGDLVAEVPEVVEL